MLQTEDVGILRARAGGHLNLRVLTHLAGRKSLIKWTRRLSSLFKIEIKQRLRRSEMGHENAVLPAKIYYLHVT